MKTHEPRADHHPGDLIERLHVEAQAGWRDFLTVLLNEAAALESQAPEIERLTKELQDTRINQLRVNKETCAAVDRWRNKAITAEQRVAVLEGALRECVRVMEIDEPRFNEWHDAVADAEKLLSPEVKDG